ncbi:MAG: transglycosylase SLT domain-containing protein, partial [Thiopseudomonas sp.]
MRTGFISLVAGCLLAATAQPALADGRLQLQRTLYQKAKTELEAGRRDTWLNNQAALKDYPLASYLAYDELTLRLRTASDAEVEQFLEHNADLPQLRWLKLRWLRLLAERDQWPLFYRHYQPSLNFAELDCLSARGQLATGKRAEAFAAAEKLWLTSQSQPNACDPLFSSWKDAGLRTQDMVWARLFLAVDARNQGLAQYLAREYIRPDAAQRLIDVAAKPEKLQQTGTFAHDTAENRAIVSLGLRRLMRSDSELTLKLLNHYKTRLAFTGEQKRMLARDIGTLLAKRFDARGLAVMAEFDPQVQEPLVGEWHARLLLRLGRWDEARNLINKLPEETASTLRWQYWQARSTEFAEPGNKAPKEQYTKLASERDFYAYMAADHSQQPYQLNHKPVPVDAALLERVRKSPLILRALEFHALGDTVAAQREWQHASQVFSHEEQLAQARIAYEMNWFNPAIRNLGQARYWDDLEIRFPMAYREGLLREARAQGLHSSWVYAITRQESAFMPGIRSHAGAMGLMQLMPATASETARRYNIPLA